MAFSVNSSSMEFVDSGEILEGLLCPICMRDLGSVSQLEDHFKDFHSNEDKVVIRSLKELFGKAKKKILNFDLNGPDSDRLLPLMSSSSNPSLSSDESLLWEKDQQEIGVTRSYFQDFKKTRDLCTDRYAVETNKLLLRLSKLITNCPNDPNKRKEHERKVVDWAPDKCVPVCPQCGITFSIVCRKHHCRLCGAIACWDCSDFITFEFARRLVYPTSDIVPVKSASSGEGQMLLAAFGKLSSSLSSPGSPLYQAHNMLLNFSSPDGATSNSEHKLRVCFECLRLIKRRDQQIAHVSQKTRLTQLYEQMIERMKKSEELIETYQTLTDSLWYGESNYKLEDAQELRFTLMKSAESIDKISKCVAALTTEDESPAVQKLHRSIRIRACTFIQSNLVGLRGLPSTEEYLELQKRRQKHELVKAAAQRKEYLTPDYSVKPKNGLSTNGRSPAVRPHNLPTDGVSVYENGWGPDSSKFRSKFEDDCHPLVMQMDLIRSYITQAKAAHKYDEVRMLEANLKELKMEYQEHLKSDDKCDSGAIS